VIEDLLASASMTSDNAPQERIDLATVVQAAARAWLSTPKRLA
jgi:hypothetical protein